jgi:hypothetical protein
MNEEDCYESQDALCPCPRHAHLRSRLYHKEARTDPLVSKPTANNTGVVNVSGVLDAKIQIEPFIDTRTGAKWGENSENQEGSVLKPVATSGCAAAFCTQNFGTALGQFGLSIVPELGDAVQKLAQDESFRQRFPAK